MHTLQNDMLTQIMTKHIRKREYIDIFRLGVGCIIVFVGGVRGGVGACVCLGSCCMWLPGLHGDRIQASGERGFRGFRSVCVGNGRYLGKCLRSDGLFLYQR